MAEFVISANSVIESLSFCARSERPRGVRCANVMPIRYSSTTRTKKNVFLDFSIESLKLFVDSSPHPSKFFIYS